MPDAEDALDLEEAFSQIALDLFASGSVKATLQRIVRLAEVTIEGCDAAGLLVVRDGSPSTLAASLEAIQIETGEGPCLDASTGGSTIYPHDLLGDTRWPVFAPAAIDAGVRCVLAYSLGVGQSALNLYSRYPDAFGVTDRAQGHLFATLAGLALDSAEERAADEEHVINLNDALRTRELIGQAQGILIERERITPTRHSTCSGVHPNTST